MQAQNYSKNYDGKNYFMKTATAEKTQRVFGVQANKKV